MYVKDLNSKRALHLCWCSAAPIHWDGEVHNDTLILLRTCKLETFLYLCISFCSTQEPPPGSAVEHCRFLGTGGGRVACSLGLKGDKEQRAQFTYLEGASICRLSQTICLKSTAHSKGSSLEKSFEIVLKKQSSEQHHHV